MAENSWLSHGSEHSNDPVAGTSQWATHAVTTVSFPLTSSLRARRHIGVRVCGRTCSMVSASHSAQVPCYRRIHPASARPTPFAPAVEVERNARDRGTGLGIAGKASALAGGATAKARRSGREALAALAQPGWQLRLRPCGHTAGCRSSAAPGTARHRLTAVTPAERTRRGRPSSRRSVLSRAKITVKSAPACGLRVLRMALGATLDCDLPSTHLGAHRKNGQDRRLPERDQLDALSPPGPAPAATAASRLG